MSKQPGSKVLSASLLLSVVIMWTLYGNIATFYPPYKKHHHPTITDTMVGTVLAMMEVGILVSSPFISMTLQKVGRKNFIIIGHILMILSSIGFGLLVYIEKDSAFFWTSIGLRLIQGFGDSCASISIFSIIGTEYTENQELYFGYLESAVGIGLMLGPVIGQLMYNKVGFEKTFYCTAIIISVSLLLQLFLIPRRLNYSVGESIVKDEVNPTKKLTFKIFLKNKRALMASFSAMLAMIFMLFYDTIYSNYLISIHISEDYLGYFFALACAVYSFSAPLVGYISKFVPKVYLT
jgi:MFS transporter, ACDE family, multidrug resistance protein